jgi:hypothetical protein
MSAPALTSTPFQVGLAGRLPDFSAARVEESKEDALARSREEGRAEGIVEALRDRERLEEAFEVRLAMARREVAGEAGTRLAAEFAAALDAFCRDLDAEVARVLTPIVDEAVRAKALAAFAAAIRRLIDGGVAVAEVCGPPDLLDAFARELGPARAALTLTETGDAELTARAGRTRLATDLESWAGTLRALIGESGDAR